MLSYSIKRKIKNGILALLKCTPRLGLSKYFAFWNRWLTWADRPPPAIANEIVNISTPLTQFQMFLLADNSFVSAGIYADKIWESHVTRIFEASIKEGDVVVDIGANIGYYSVLAGRLAGKTGAVFAFEPANDNYEMLLRNIRLNKLDGVVIPVQKALGEENLTKNLYEPRKDDSSGRVLFPVSHAAKIQTVECIRLEDYFRVSYPEYFDRIRLIKMDIEGYEPCACKGMKSLLKKDDVTLFTELNFDRLRQAGFSAVSYVEFLQSYGFKIYSIQTNQQSMSSLLKPLLLEDLKEEPNTHLDLYCFKNVQALNKLKFN